LIKTGEGEVNKIIELTKAGNLGNIAQYSHNFIEPKVIFLKYRKITLTS